MELHMSFAHSDTEYVSKLIFSLHQNLNLPEPHLMPARWSETAKKHSEIPLEAKFGNKGSITFNEIDKILHKYPIQTLQ
jgi:hypothetical protein